MEEGKNFYKDVLRNLFVMDLWKHYLLWEETIYQKYLQESHNVPITDPNFALKVAYEKGVVDGLKRLRSYRDLQTK